MMITDRLLGDHKTFRKLTGDLDAVADAPPARRDPRALRRAVRLLKDHLVVHAWFEDRFYYPAVREALATAQTPPLTDAYMRHLEEEHRTIDGYADRLERETSGPAPAPAWPQTFALFSHGLKVHLRKEEEELFPLSERLLGAARLEALADEMERRRGEAPAPRPHAPPEAP